MARPKQKEELKRQNKITIRLSDSEHGKISNDAQELGVTMSSYIRAKALHGYIRIPKYAKIDNELIGMLSKLGGLFKKVHIESGGVYRPHIPATIAKIQTVLATIQNQLECAKVNKDYDRQTHSEPEGTQLL